MLNKSLNSVKPWQSTLTKPVTQLGSVSVMFSPRNNRRKLCHVKHPFANALPMQLPVKITIFQLIKWLFLCGFQFLSRKCVLEELEMWFKFKMWPIIFRCSPGMTWDSKTSGHSYLETLKDSSEDITLYKGCETVPAKPCFRFQVVKIALPGNNQWSEKIYPHLIL